MRLPKFNDESDYLRLELLGIVKKFAYAKRDVVLASGQKSDFYIDCKQVSFRGEGAFALGRLFFEAMHALETRQGISFSACGGMALGAIPISMALTLHAFANGKELPSVSVRKEQKEHGTRSAVEGSTHIASNSQVLLVEDVVTTGQSTIMAGLALREAGFIVEHVLAIVDRQAGGEANLKTHGFGLQSLYDLSDF